jgi:hypothetical protein
MKFIQIFMLWEWKQNTEKKVIFFSKIEIKIYPINKCQIISSLKQSSENKNLPPKRMPFQNFSFPFSVNVHNQIQEWHALREMPRVWPTGNRRKIDSSSVPVHLCFCNRWNRSPTRSIKNNSRTRAFHPHPFPCIPCHTSLSYSSSPISCRSHSLCKKYFMYRVDKQLGRVWILH